MARPIKTSLMVPNFSKFSPIIPVRRPDIFDSSDWVYEIKYDGFRALAYLDEGCCRFVSRKGNEMKRFADLCSAIGKALKVKSAVLDGEIVALDESGMPAFYHLMRRKCHAVYYAFDLLCWREKTCATCLWSIVRKSCGLFSLKNRPGLVTSISLTTRAKRLFELVKA
jgi:ATP-dependent DNA ligase